MELQRKAIERIKKDIERHEMLLRVTKHSKRRDRHRFNLAFLKMVLHDMEEDYAEELKEYGK